MNFSYINNLLFTPLAVSYCSYSTFASCLREMNLASNTADAVPFLQSQTPFFVSVAPGCDSGSAGTPVHVAPSAGTQVWSV